MRREMIITYILPNLFSFFYSGISIPYTKGYREVMRRPRIFKVFQLRITKKLFFYHMLCACPLSVVVDFFVAAKTFERLIERQCRRLLLKWTTKVHWFGPRSILPSVWNVLTDLALISTQDIIMDKPNEQSYTTKSGKMGNIDTVKKFSMSRIDVLNRVRLQW